MCNQLRVEFFKLRHFWLFYLAVIGMSAAGFSYGYIKLTSVGYGVYDAFTETNCDTSFVFIHALVSAWFIGSDFSNRTIHHEPRGTADGRCLASRYCRRFCRELFYIVSIVVPP